jgi:hypothetical protein
LLLLLLLLLVVVVVVGLSVAVVGSPWVVKGGQSRPGVLLVGG